MTTEDYKDSDAPLEQNQSLSQQQTLAQVIYNFSPLKNLPQPLPLGHVSIAKWFKGIVDGGELKPCCSTTTIITQR
ncbi:MAG: hypothetical protein KDJ65_32305 [Anaerolineae bacterium]|nr:hypothetical protein [Anaerolineae bacterium]